MTTDTLTRADRCDRCSAAAMAVAELPTGGYLYFCGHHVNQYGSAMLASGAIITRVVES